MDWIIKLIIGALGMGVDKLKKWHDEKIAAQNALQVKIDAAKLESIKQAQAAEHDITQAAAGMSQHTNVNDILEAFGKQPQLGTTTVPVTK